MEYGPSTFESTARNPPLATGLSRFFTGQILPSDAAKNRPQECGNEIGPFRYSTGNELLEFSRCDPVTGRDYHCAEDRNSAFNLLSVESIHEYRRKYRVSQEVKELIGANPPERGVSTKGRGEQLRDEENEGDDDHRLPIGRFVVLAGFAHTRSTGGQHLMPPLNSSVHIRLTHSHTEPRRAQAALVA